jgi:outer membrane immunogenic protein
MKKILLGSAALVMISVGSAVAADMPVKAPPLPPPVMLWDAVYIGLEGGYGWGENKWGQTFSSFGIALDGTNGNHEVNGGLAGGVFGFTRQYGSWVWGAEFSWDWADLKGTRGHVLFPLYSNTSKVDWLATLTGRVGYVVGANQNWLLYAKGGYAVADETHHINFTGVPVTTGIDSTRNGWVAGAGVEYAFGTGIGFFSNASAKFEYNYMDLGRRTFEFRYLASPAGLVEDWSVKQQVHVFKVGLNWRGLPFLSNF